MHTGDLVPMIISVNIVVVLVVVVTVVNGWVLLLFLCRRYNVLNPVDDSP